MVLRAYQYYYAVEAILDKALNTNNNGCVWHTTGSGKTLTSFKVAKILQNEPKIDKVIFIVDRRDLDYQTTKEFNSFCEDSVDGTDNTRSLIKQLNDKSSCLIITTIQKLDIAVKKYKNELNNVKDFKMILMFDECHRSQFGDMHKNITSYFTNIQYFGFTGTPIFAVNANKNRTTADLKAFLLDKSNCLINSNIYATLILSLLNNSISKSISSKTDTFSRGDGGVYKSMYFDL